MAEPSNYVLTVYKTEAAAITGDTSTAFAVDGDGKINTAGQGAGYGFWTHEKYFYRIEANEPVTEFYIDWDDGEDNDPNGKANYTSIKFDTPTFVGITSHIYTGNSTTSGGYFPKIRAKSVDGFMSKFYQNRAGAFSHTGIDVLAGETSLTEGRNDTYRIESDNTTERVPALYPQIKPPVGILKADKKRVYAGIFNNYLYESDNTVDATGETVTLIEVPNAGSAVRTGVTVRVTYTTTGEDGSKNAGRGDVKVTDMSTGGTATLSNVSKILKVELINLLEDSVAYNDSGTKSTTKLFPGEKMALVKGSYSSSTEQTIAEVSLGNPIVILDDPRYTVTYDLTESFARTSEQSISNYYIDDGARRLNNGFAHNTKIQESVNDTEATAHSDILNNPTNDNHSVPSGVKRCSYAFDVGFNVVDSDFRWLPKQVLARGQVKMTNPLGTTAKRNMQHSYLEHWLNEGHTKNYSDTMEDIATYNWTSDISSSAVLAFKGIDDDEKWVDLEGSNKLAGQGGHATSFLMRGTTAATGSLVRLFANADCDTLADTDNKAMLVCARDSKWTKQYWKTLFNNATVQRGKADYAIPGSSLDNEGVGTTGVGHMNIRVEAYYTGYADSSGSKKVWKPLKYTNKTKHPDYDDSTWYTDGIFEWEEPDDWISVDPATLEDYSFPRGDYFTDGGDAEDESWAYSTHNQAGTIVEDIAGTAEATTLTVTLSNKAKITGGWVALQRGATDSNGTQWDIFYWDATGAQAAPDGAAIASGTSGIADDTVVASINEVDISAGDETTEIHFAADLAAVINAHSSYSCSQVSSLGSATAAVAVTNAVVGSVTDSPVANSQYPNGGGANGHSVSVTTQGVNRITGFDYFDDDGGQIWNEDNTKFGMMFLIKTDGGAGSKPDSYGFTDILNTWPCSNAHSAIVDLIDPMHVSLNSFAITQSITYTHKGKHQIVEDRLGKSDIRKIGASGGILNFGGIDLAGDTVRDKFYEFQTKATPVYLDVSHEDSTKSRFFGVITSMSRDHPTGKVKPKFGVQMQVSHMITINSSGNITSDDYISLGGSIDEPKYI